MLLTIKQARHQHKKAIFQCGFQSEDFLYMCFDMLIIYMCLNTFDHRQAGRGVISILNPYFITHTHHFTIRKSTFYKHHCFPWTTKQAGVISILKPYFIIAGADFQSRKIWKSHFFDFSINITPFHKPRFCKINVTFSLNQWKTYCRPLQQLLVQQVKFLPQKKENRKTYFGSIFAPS